MLKACFLGQFGLLLDGEPVVLPSRPAQSLLAFLIMNKGSAHRREKLAGAIWPDSTDDNARRNLRQALWRTRKALNDTSQVQRYIVSDPINLEFNLNSRHWLDVDQLETLTSSNPSIDELKAALSLYRGPLLPGFYEDWLMLERERLQAVFEREAERLIELLQAEQRWDDILEWAERWITYGQSPEPAYRGLMVAYSALGNQSGVVVTYARCTSALQENLGVEPSAVTKDLYSRLLHENDITETELVQTRPMPPPDRRRISSIPPYKGLLFFEETDADFFFGRGLLVNELVDHIVREPFLALIGASGSGKSSLARAGIVPVLKNRLALSDSDLFSGEADARNVQVITPTNKPLESLAATIKKFAPDTSELSALRTEMEQDPPGFVRAISRELPAAGQFFLIVDQFEEIFTLCRDPFEREAFVDHLLSAVSGDFPTNISVVIVLRADFYGHCAQYESLRQALVDHQVFLGPMHVEDLRRAIEEPARLGGLDIEPGLVDLILADVGDEPGGLPLLSHALLETWNRREGFTLTLKGYTDSGGVRGAISRTAENVYRNLSAHQREITRQIFLQLTELSETASDTRRRIKRSEFTNISDDEETVQNLLHLLADARLVTLADNTVEVAHEALIRTWDRLRTWLDDSRDIIRRSRTLRMMALEWESAGKDASFLASGARLQQFERVMDEGSKLGALEQQYIDASLEEREHQVRREQARAAHEAVLEQRARFIMRSLVLVLLAATAGALLLSGFAWKQRSIAQDNETAAQALALTSGAQFAASQGEDQLALALAWSASQLDPSNVQAQLALSDLAYKPGIWQRMFEHTDRVSAVAFSPDGSQALSGSWDATLMLWDVHKGKSVRQLTEHQGRVTSVAITPDGKTALSGSADTTMILWDLTDGSIVYRFAGHSGEITGIAVSPDGRLAVSGSVDETIKLWDLESGALLRTLVGHDGGVLTVAFSPDGAHFASGSSDRDLILWNVISGDLVRRFEGHLGAVTSVVFNPEGNAILSGSLDQVLILWDSTSGEVIHRFEGHQDQVNDVAFSPDGQTAISSGGSEEAFNTTQEPVLLLWDVTNGELLQRFEGHSAPVTAVEFSPNGRFMLSGSSDRSIILWGLKSGAEIRRFDGQSKVITSISVSADGRFALSASADTSMVLWEVASGKPLQQFLSETIIHAASISPGGQYALSGSPDGRVALWDVGTGQTTGELIGHTGPVTSVVFSPDGKMALSGSADRTVILWEVESRRIRQVFSGHENVVTSVAFRSDAKRVLSGSFDQTMILWDVETGRAVRSYHAQGSVVNAVAFSPDGKRGLSGHSDGDLILWDLESGVQMRHFEGQTGPVYAAAYSPDGKTVLSGSRDQHLIAWDVSSGQPIRRFFGHTDAVRAVAFGPNGRHVFSGSLDGSLILWRIDTLEELFEWTKSHRYIVELSCEQQANYLLQPNCDEEVGAP